MGSLLGELSALTRDLLIRKTAPQGGAALLTGGYDENTMRRLSNQFQTARLVQMLGLLQTTIADLSRSGNRRTDTELRLIRLCDPGLDESTAALNARLARVEELLAKREFTSLKGLLYFTDGKGIFPQKMPRYETAFVLMQKEYEEIDVPAWAIKIYLDQEEMQAYKEGITDEH